MSAEQTRLRHVARQYIEAHQHDAAQATLEQLVNRDPGDASARMELAQLMRQRGQLRASTVQLVHAADVIADDPALLIQLVRQLYFGGEVVAARDCLERLDRIGRAAPPLLAARAHLRWILGEIPASRNWMDRALAAGIDSPNEHHLHAMLLQFSGDIDQAVVALEACVRRWPSFGAAALALSNLRRQTPQANHLEAIREQLRRLSSRAANPDQQLVRAQFEAALFKELDDLGHHDEAWQALARSKAIMRALNPYDGVAEAAVTDALIRASDAMGKVAPRQSHARPDGPMPIFIVGMPRSGTTLLDRMLSSHSEVVSAGEINDFLRQLHWVADVPPAGVAGMLKVLERSAQIDFAELGARYLAQTQWRAQGRRYFVDKLPINIQMVPFIRRALPHAPILHMVREPMDVCFSNYRALFGDISAYSNDLAALGQHYRQYVRLVDHWRATMPDAMLDVSYQALVSHSEETLRRVLKRCDLPLQDACLHPERNAAPVATPSSVQVRDPVHSRAIGQWQPYARQLEPLRMAIEDLSTSGRRPP